MTVPVWASSDATEASTSRCLGSLLWLKNGRTAIDAATRERTKATAASGMPHPIRRAGAVPYRPAPFGSMPAR